MVAGEAMRGLDDGLMPWPPPDQLAGSSPAMTNASFAYRDVGGEALRSAAADAARKALASAISSRIVSAFAVRS